MIPKIEDGNNFGVSVQVRKLVLAISSAKRVGFLQRSKLCLLVPSIHVEALFFCKK